MMKRLLFMCAVVVPLVSQVEPVRAAMIYTDQASFVAHLVPGYYLETFDTEGFPSFGSIPTPTTFSANGFVYSADATNGLFTVTTDGTIALSTADSTDPLVLTFTSGNVTAFGGNFFLTDLPGNATTGMMQVDLNDGTSVVLTDQPTNGFLGFTSDVPILSATFTSLTAEDGGFPTVDNVYAGTAVPEPSTFVVSSMLLGLFGAARLRGRQIAA